MGKFLFGLIFIILLAFAAVVGYFRFTEGSFTAAGPKLDSLFGMAKEEVQKGIEKLGDEIDDATDGDEAT